MKQFVFGTTQQFSELDRLMADGMCHIFSNCSLPDSCTPHTTRIGFEKEGNIYTLLIDYGITTTSSNQAFKDWLTTGYRKFVMLDDMIAFLHSLQPLFTTSSAPTPNHPSNSSDNDIVDVQRILSQRNQSNSPKLINPDAIALPIKQQIFGQDQAIDQLAELIVMNRFRQKRKLLVVMLLGPTATGKSETAKSLAEILTKVYGQPYGFIEVAANEFVGEHSTARFFGAPPGYVGHGKPTLLDPVRKNPRHVIVLNEIEKADPKLIEGLMEAVDTGHLGMADNSPDINLNESILLLTSNLPINMKEYALANEFQRDELCRNAFTKHCGRPEISGKIGNYIVYVNLDAQAIIKILIKFTRMEFDNYQLRLVKIDDQIINFFLDYNSKYGARPIRNAVSNIIGKQFTRFIFKNQIDTASLRGKSIALKGSIDSIVFEII